MAACLTEAARYEAWYHTRRGAWIGDIEYRLLSRLLAAQPGESVLDVGCGTGWFTRRVADGSKVQAIGLDPNFDWLGHAYTQAASGELFVAGRAEQLPLRDKSVDRTLCVAALCFVSDPVQAVREMVRVTRRRLVLGVLNRHSLLYLQKGRHGGRGGYRGARWHTASEIRRLLSDLRLRDVELRGAIILPSGGAIARGVEALWPQRWLAGAFLAAAASIA